LLKYHKSFLLATLNCIFYVTQEKALLHKKKLVTFINSNSLVLCSAETIHFMFISISQDFLFLPKAQLTQPGKARKKQPAKDVTTENKYRHISVSKERRGKELARQKARRLAGLCVCVCVCVCAGWC